MRFLAELDGATLPLEVTLVEGRHRVRLGDEELEVDARQPAEGIWSLLLEGASHVADVSEEDGVFVVQVDGETYRIRVEEETRYIIRTRGGASGGRGQVLRAPMPGRVTHVAARAGQEVRPGDPLVVLEAMKMENEFRAGAAGVVREVRVEVGQAVNAGDVLVVIE